MYDALKGAKVKVEGKFSKEFMQAVKNSEGGAKEAFNNITNPGFKLSGSILDKGINLDVIISDGENSILSITAESELPKNKNKFFELLELILKGNK